MLTRLKRLLRPAKKPVARTFTRTPESILLETDKWASSEVVLGLAKIVSVRPYPLDELLLMSAAFQYHRPEMVIDIGTHVGKSARIWYELSRKFNPQCAVHTIDLCDPQHAEFPGERLGSYIHGLPVTQHIGDGYAIAKDLVESNIGKRLLLFLDGDHGFDTVRRELELLKPNEETAALVHDTFYQPGSSYYHGPYLAIEEFRREFSCAQVFHLQLGLPGMSYLSR